MVDRKWVGMNVLTSSGDGHKVPLDRFIRSTPTGLFTATNVTDGDFFPPSTVNDLAVIHIIHDTRRVTLQWTAVADDLDSRDSGPGNFCYMSWCCCFSISMSMRPSRQVQSTHALQCRLLVVNQVVTLAASFYEIRLCQESKQLRANFSSCNLVQQNIRPKEAFVTEATELLLTHVSYGATVFIGLKVVDDEEHYSELSNVVSVYFVGPREEENDDAGNNILIVVVPTIAAFIFLLPIIIVVTIGCRRRPNSEERVYENWKIVKHVQKSIMRRPSVPDDIENHVYENAAMTKEAEEPLPDSQEPLPEAKGPPPGPKDFTGVKVMF